MKRYLRFEFDTYYPDGADMDFLLDADSMEGALYSGPGTRDNVVIIDTELRLSMRTCAPDYAFTRWETVSDRTVR